MAVDSKNGVFVLGAPQAEGIIAVLCRSSGLTPGPAFCQNKRDAMKLKTKLANDPRGQGNQRALEIINSLLIYEIPYDTELTWRDGDLWAYITEDQASCAERKWF